MEPDVELALKEKVSAIFTGKTDWKLDRCVKGNEHIELSYSKSELICMRIIAKTDGWVYVSYGKSGDWELCFEDMTFYNHACGIFKEYNINRLKSKIDVL